MCDRVIDVGSAAGRVSCTCRRGDLMSSRSSNSPLAARVCRMRGVGETWCTTSEKLTENVGSFDTVVLFGNNFGIFGTPQRLRHVLTQWSVRMAPVARIWPRAPIPTLLGFLPSIGKVHTPSEKRAGDACPDSAASSCQVFQPHQRICPTGFSHLGRGCYFCCAGRGGT